MRRLLLAAALFSIAVSALAGEGLIVPVITHADGANGERFRTLVAISNRGSDNVLFHLLAFPEGESSCGRQPAFGGAQELTPGATVEVAIPELLELLAIGGSGHLEIVGDPLSRTSDLAVTTRIYAEVDAGTFGQDIPLLDNLHLPLAGLAQHLIGLQKDDTTGTRTNLGIFVPASDCPDLPNDMTEVRIVGYWNDGLANFFDKIEVPGGALTRINDVFGAHGIPGCPDCRVEISATVPILVYASIVDGATSDPVLVRGVSR